MEHNNRIINDFLKTQQKFIIDWNDSTQKQWEVSHFSKLKSVRRKIEPYVDFLPEPYLGDPFNAKAVFLNYNPGPVIVDCQNKTIGSFIKDFNAVENYKNFAINTPYYTHKSGFWADRMKFLSRLTNSSFEESKIFALEICPWHSSSFKLSESDLKNSKKYFQENVLNIAEVVAQNSSVKTIFSVGKDYYNLFKLLGFKLVKEIDQTTKDKRWPVKKDGTKVNRSISIWKSNTNGVYFNTWAPGSNRISSKEFDNIILDLIS